MLESNGVSFEHMPSGIDTLCVVVSSADLEGKSESIVREIKLECRPDSVEIEHGIALIIDRMRLLAHVIVEAIDQLADALRAADALVG